MKLNPYKPVIYLSILTVVSFISISYLKTALELEDAEQAYYSQWWSLGYDDQPPLYTWLQKILILLFGQSKFSFALLRGTLYAATLIALAGLTKKLGIERHKQGVFLFLVVLIPVFSDFAFRRLSHTVLMCLMVVLSLLVLDKLIKKRSFRNYGLFGLCIGIGLLSKYNYAIFLVALLTLGFFDVTIQKIFINRRITISILIAILLNTPHFIWLLSEGNLLKMTSSLTEKTTNKLMGIPVLTSFLATLKTFFQLVLPLLTVLFLLLATKRATFNKAIKKDWFLKLFMLQTVIVFSIFILFDAQKVEVRWLLPLYLPYVILLLKYTDFRNAKYWSEFGIVIYLVLVFVQVIRTPIEKLFGIPSSVHNEYNLFVHKIDQYSTADCLAVLPDVTYAGQVYFLRPNKKVVFRGDYSIPKEKLKAKEYLIVRKNNLRPSNANGILLDSIIGFGKDKDTLRFYSFQGTKKLSVHSLSFLLNKTLK